jgi:hypothetical protein
MKTILAPGFKARLLGLTAGTAPTSWATATARCSTTPSFKSKEVSKLGVLEHILQPHLYPELYGKYSHVVRINYYPPRGDNKEGWDNIDIFGWLGYPMQIKIDFLCRDSILAAPIVLDLALFLDLAQRAGMSGVQEWLSFYFKSPMTAPEACTPSTTCSFSSMKLKNTSAIPDLAECQPPVGVELPAEGSDPALVPANLRWRCTFSVPPLYRRAALLAVAMEWGDKSVEVPPQKVAMVYAAAAKAVPSAPKPREDGVQTPRPQPSPPGEDSAEAEDIESADEDRGEAEEAPH